MTDKINGKASYVFNKDRFVPAGLRCASFYVYGNVAHVIYIGWKFTLREGVEPLYASSERSRERQHYVRSLCLYLFSVPLLWMGM